ncbi:Phasin protein [Duganella sp. CF517]|uniref:phasin family protein n=1 Tax=Duganella sp. CF517 TaxID=1881038 RepID=UPI0008D05E3B|nr:phasin family protein [Duganella sp. CF517]SEO03038.1 Phasin protein [Duganella sp. CF517]
MNSFVETISPAAKNHIEARIAYFNDVSLAMVQTMRELAEVNLQFSRSWMQDSTQMLQTALLTPPTERADASPSVEAVAQKLQTYQQQLVKITSDFQTNINQVAQQHVPQTARTATELADVVTQKAAAQTDQQLRMQKAAGKEILDQATQFAQVAAQNRAMQQPASMQSDENKGNKS